MIIQYKLLIAFSIVIIGLIIAIPANEMYTHENSTLILQPNGNYRVVQEQQFAGTYHRYGNTVELSIPFGVLTLTECDGRLVDEDGDRWVRVK